ncbi:13255_t:CDS:2 [Dentiscutata erythropus]|uniref:13255_t:CDS:1 n=1 Tax=Dentiscutata erythropus TaxID=1348616 RepID=A0A9N9NF13_9GLOM|nr:13255_t:CDS:2 [Dentiscutata erythropus]
MDSVDQHVKNDIMLDNEKIKTIIINLLDKSLYIAETAQAILTHIQAIEPIATEEILDDEGIISIIQAKKNNISTSLYSQDSYYQDLYPRDIYSQDLYPQDSYSYNSYSPDLSSQDLSSQDLSFQDLQSLYPQDSYFLI